jgi:peptidoglycan/xylan/chitin deacetylase (PgdA/CDA1 family)
VYNLEVIVVGAGIGGLTTALALQRTGHRVKVIDQVRQLRPIGAGISLWSNGLKVLDALGLGQEVAAAGGRMQRMGYLDKAGTGSHLDTVVTNDMRFATPQGFNSGEQFFAYCRDAFDVLYAEGASAPKMLSIGLHARIEGRLARFAALQRLIDHTCSHDQVWVTRRVDIARHWMETFAP